MTEQEKKTTEEVNEEDEAVNEQPGAEDQEAAQAEQPGSADMEDRYLRLVAEYQNYRRRTEKEKNDIFTYGAEKLALDVLEVIDNFDRAMDSKPADDKFADGMELILKQLVGVLEKHDIKEIDALGKPFDPNFHNAVMTEAAEGTESGIVMKVLQKGYMLNDRVIRPSMVSVSQ